MAQCVGFTPKLIGATAHDVTADLDEGEIFEQEIERVTHAMSLDDFVAAGREIESRMLARAVKLRLESRTFTAREFFRSNR